MQRTRTEKKRTRKRTLTEGCQDQFHAEPKVAKTNAIDMCQLFITSQSQDGSCSLVKHHLQKRTPLHTINSLGVSFVLIRVSG